MEANKHHATCTKPLRKKKRGPTGFGAHKNKRGARQKAVQIKESQTGEKHSADGKNSGDKSVRKGRTTQENRRISEGFAEQVATTVGKNRGMKENHGLRGQ